MGGGSSAGKIEYPAYIVTSHGRFLDHTGEDMPDVSITSVFNETLTRNPFLGEVAFDPSPHLAAYEAELEAFRTLLLAIDPVNNYAAFTLAAESNTDAVFHTDYLTAPLIPPEVNDAISASLAAFTATTNDTLENILLPPFKAGMLNINAVTSSAFPIGEAIIRGVTSREIARFGADINTDVLKTATIQRSDAVVKYNTQRNETIRMMCADMVGSLLRKTELANALTVAAHNVATLQISSRTEQNETQLSYDEFSAKWELHLFQSVSNFYAGPGGGVAPGQHRPPTAVRVASGAIGGAAAGASIGTAVAGGASAGSAGGIYGAIIGAVVGAGLALASG